LGLETALELIESVKDYRVLFVGDSIVDEYHYVHQLGKSPKENVIPMRYLEQEVFRGGVEAAANHARSFCGTVDLCRSPMETRKVRFVDKTFMRKLAEVHYQNGVPSRDGFMLDDYDVTVVADFGHGQVSGEMISELSKRFLAVNAQTNSANIGFNLITKYPRADYIVIDENEARLAAHDRDSHIEDVIHKLAFGRCDKFVVTLGTKGAVGYESGNFYRSNAVSDKVVDTMGAGDAFFSVTAPMAKTGRMEDLLLIGNAAGALKCRIVGHREAVTKDKLIDFLRETA
jgi:bifunctional ADP-heptose synthase (sugar kinase/adenylyltransferase)